MIGGDAAVMERCMPVFQAIGKTFTRVGASGAGQACKSCNQLVIVGAQLFAALCNTGREGLDNAALGLLIRELSGIKK